MKDFKFALVTIKQNFKNDSELKSVFFMYIFGMAINNIAFLIIWYYFGKTIGDINGWAPTDIFGLYGFSAISFGMINIVFSGIYSIPGYIASGNLDKFLLTPKNILLKISTSKMAISSFGDLLYGITCFIIFCIINKFSMIQILNSFLLIIATSIIFYSFSLICMSFSFYLMDGQNISNGFYFIFLSNSLYHGGAYTGILRFVFIFIVPSLLVSSIPVEIMNTLSIEKIIIILISTIFWLTLSIWFFYKSLKKYESNNFFGFGG